MSKKTLSLDFDGVCHKYITPWVDEMTIPDGPVEGLFPFLIKADEHFTVNIYSMRSETAAGRFAMAIWFKRWGKDYANTCALSKKEFDHLIDVIERLRFPTHKPKAFVGLDDRILTFEGMWPSPEILLGWQPWNKRKDSKLRLPIVADRESFYVMKELLRRHSFERGDSMSMSMMARRDMEALRRLYDQIRDLEYPNV